MPRTTTAAFLVTYLPMSFDDKALGRLTSYVVAAKSAHEAGGIAERYTGFLPALCQELSAETVVALAKQAEADDADFTLIE